MAALIIQILVRIVGCLVRHVLGNEMAEELVALVVVLQKLEGRVVDVRRVAHLHVSPID